MLTVLNVAFPLAPVGPDAVGGAEQVLTQLDGALVRAGHRSVVIAVEGSQTAGELVSLPRPPGVLGPEAWARAHEAQRAAIAQVLARERVDLVHLHGVDFHHYLPPPGPPVLVTLHLPAADYPDAALRSGRPLTFLHCVSASQRALFPPGTPLLEDLPNGVDLDRFRPARRKRDYALALGRICPEKGFHLALEASAAAGVPFVLAGSVFGFPEHARYFEAEIRPRLGRRARFIGPAERARKRRLLAGARCLVVPSLVPETSSLVAMEALASGTPVVAFRRGALPQIVEHGVTGFLVDGDREGELAAAIDASASLSPAACREAAEARFSLPAAMDRYLSLYARIAVAGPSRAPQVALGDGRPGASAERSPLRTEVACTVERLDAVVGAWHELWRRAPGATPFTSPAWLLPWCRNFGREPFRVLLAWSGETLRGVLPTFAYPAGAERVLGLLGGGVSDYQDVLAEDDRVARELLRTALSWLGGEVDRIDLEGLPAGSALLRAAGDEGGGERRESDTCPVLRLPRLVAELSLRCSPNLARDVAYQRRRLAREGGLEVVLAGPDTLEGLLEELFRLHAARWSSRGQGSGVLDGERLRAFHLEAGRGLLAAGALRLLALRSGGTTLGVLLGFANGGRAFAYLPGVDPARLNRSPGSLLFAQAIEDAIAEGCTSYDSLRGREPYKYRWGAEDTTTSRLIWTARAS